VSAYFATGCLQLLLRMGTGHDMLWWLVLCSRFLACRNRLVPAAAVVGFTANLAAISRAAALSCLQDTLFHARL
jgi:hypothetical protein